MTDELTNALERARREVVRLETIIAARADATHEHEWWEFDGSRHCFKCRTTEHGPYPGRGVRASSGGAGPHEGEEP